MHPELRWTQRFTNYTAALTELKQALQQTEYTVLERSGLIRMFEVTFELAWKTLKDLLSYEGYDAKSPRAVIKQAFQNNLIMDGELWLTVLEGRNLFAHVYSQEMAENAVKDIKEMYAPLLIALEDVLNRVKD